VAKTSFNSFRYVTACVVEQCQERIKEKVLATYGHEGTKEFTVHFSTSFSTTRTSFRQNGAVLSCRHSHSGLRHFLDDFCEYCFGRLPLGFLFTHSPVGRLHKQTTILMRETPQISIVPTNDGDRCSILLTIAERLAINSPYVLFGCPVKT
jgi:hypothetical protein